MDLLSTGPEIFISTCPSRFVDLSDFNSDSYFVHSIMPKKKTKSSLRSPTNSSDPINSFSELAEPEPQMPKDSDGLILGLVAR